MDGRPHPTRILVSSATRSGSSISRLTAWRPPPQGVVELMAVSEAGPTGATKPKTRRTKQSSGRIG